MDEEAKPVLELKNICKHFEKKSILAANNVTLQLAPTEFIAILGPSGCGKTTLLRLIAGFERPDSGEILIQGEPVVGPGVWVPPERRKIGMVFQDYALFPHLNVYQNIIFGLSHKHPHLQRAIANELLHLVELPNIGKRYPHELSGGQQQRVALARALAPTPSLILLDEPFCNLDADMRRDMRREVRRILQQTATAGLLVTHDQEEAFDIADRVGVLETGNLHQLDTPESVYHTPVSRFVADFVGQADFIKGVVDGKALRTPLGLLTGPMRCPKGMQVASESIVEVMIRPDDIILSRDPESNAAIVRRRFLGFETIFAVQLSDGTIVHGSQAGIPTLSVGDHVSIKIDLTHLVIFPLSKGSHQQ